MGTAPGAVTFTANGTSSSSNITAQINRAGTYNFLVVITDPSTGLSVSSQVSATVSQIESSITVTPASSSVAVNTTKQFTATALDQFGVAMATQPTISWSVSSGGGTISTAGLYTAPGATGTATIQAKDARFSGSASVSVISQVATTTTLSAGPVYYYGYYALETLTVVIAPSSGTVPPTGTVDLFYGGSVLATATVQIVNGVATAQFNIEYFANGAYSFSAQYLGSSSFQGSTSNTVTVMV
jgi:hypothetical protein